MSEQRSCVRKHPTHNDVLSRESIEKSKENNYILLEYMSARAEFSVTLQSSWFSIETVRRRKSVDDRCSFALARALKVKGNKRQVMSHLSLLQLFFHSEKQKARSILLIRYQCLWGVSFTRGWKRFSFISLSVRVEWKQSRPNSTLRRRW